MKLLSLSRKKVPSKTKTEVPLYNVDISFREWKGPFRNIREFEHIAKIFTRIEGLKGSFFVTNEGRLVIGSQQGLHTYKANIDLTQPNHVHIEEKLPSYLEYKNEKIFLDAYYQTPNNKPVYTLNGLYETLENNKLNTKIKALEDNLKNHKDYDFNSITRPKEIRLKLLENAYRRLISDQ